MSGQKKRADTAPPSDPRAALGPSLFLSVLSHLPFPYLLTAELVSREWRRTIRSHEKGVWRTACHRTGVESKHMATLESVQRMSSFASGGDPEEPEPEPEPVFDEAPGPVDWRAVCKDYVAMDRNWRWGRCRERWITPPGYSVWRIKVDHEQGTVLSTSRTGGLHIVDAKTSAPLFALRGIRPWAHLEFAKGFVVFDVGQVYRTQPCVARSFHPTPRTPRLPPEALTAHSYTHPVLTPSTTPLPRGHLAYYRTITPPTPCMAFRARIDREGMESERAVLGMAGEEAVYLWDLEEEGRVETIRVPPGERERVQYIEFDDDHVFLCGREQVHVFSRRTRQKLVSFPPVRPGSVRDLASLAFSIDPKADFQPVEQTAVDQPYVYYAERQPPPAAVGRAEVSGARDEDEGFEETLRGGLRTSDRRARTLMPVPVDLDFSACHFARTDLICTSRSGAILVVRNYAAALATSDPAARAAAVRDSTIWIGMKEPVKQLSTHETRVAISTSSKVIFFDTSALPPLDPVTTSDPHPASLDELPALVPLRAPTFRAHALLNTAARAVAESSCVQMDRNTVYLTYWALVEVEGVAVARRIEPAGMEGGMPPDRAVQGFGLCVRAWDFSP